MATVQWQTNLVKKEFSRRSGVTELETQYYKLLSLDGKNPCVIGNQWFSSNHLCSVARKTSVKRFLRSKTFLFKNIICIMHALPGMWKWEITGRFHQVGSGAQTQAFIHCTTLVAQRGYRPLLALCPRLDCKVSKTQQSPHMHLPLHPFFVPALHCPRMLSDPHESYSAAPRTRNPILTLVAALGSHHRIPFLNSPFQCGSWHKESATSKVLLKSIQI